MAVRSEAKNIYGANLRALRKSYGLSQDQLASRIGTSQSSIDRYEGGVVPPTVFINAAAAFFGRSLEWMRETHQPEDFCPPRDTDIRPATEYAKLEGKLEKAQEEINWYRDNLLGIILEKKKSAHNQANR